MINIAICDDELTELSHMSGLVEKYKLSRNLSVAYTLFHNGFDLAAVLDEKLHFDIFCLDIVMPALNGIDIAKEIRMYDKNAAIIFLHHLQNFCLRVIQ